MPEQWDPKINHSVTEFCQRFPNSIPNLKNIKGPKKYLQSDILANHCKVCATRFFDSRSLMNKNFNNEPKMDHMSLECAKCDHCFKNPGSLLRHIFMIHEGYRYVCKVKYCCGIYVDIKNIKTHLKTKHKIYHNHWRLIRLFD